jgi:hypothetical protein
MSLRGGAPLLAGITGDADHSDLAVRPRLLRDPFDQIVVIRILVAIVPFGLGGSPRLRDHVYVAVCDEASRIACLDGTEPQRCVGGLRRQYVRDVRALNVLVMQRRGIKHGVLARLVRSIDVHRQPRAISHGDTDIPLLDHRFVSTVFAALTAACNCERGIDQPSSEPHGRTMAQYFTIVKYKYKFGSGISR